MLFLGSSLEIIDRKYGTLKVKVTSRHVFLFNTPNSRSNINKNMNEILLPVPIYVWNYDLAKLYYIIKNKF